MIAIFFIAALIAVWQLLPLFVEPVVKIPGSEISIEYSYWPTAKRGEAWTVNATIANPGTTSISGIVLELPTDAAIEGATVSIPAIAADSSKTITLAARIKATAPHGKRTVMLSAIVPGAPVDEKTIEVEIT